MVIAQYLFNLICVCCWLSLSMPCSHVRAEGQCFLYLCRVAHLCLLGHLWEAVVVPDGFFGGGGWLSAMHNPTWYCRVWKPRVFNLWKDMYPPHWFFAFVMNLPLTWSVIVFSYMTAGWFLFIGCDIYITRGLLSCHVVLAIADLCSETMAPMLPGCTKEWMRSLMPLLWVAYSKISSQGVWYNLLVVVLISNLIGPGTILPFLLVYHCNWYWWILWYLGYMLFQLEALQSVYWCDAILFYCDGRLEFLLHASCQLSLLGLGLIFYETLWRC